MRRIWRYGWVAILLIANLGASAQTTKLEAIPLHYRSADEVVPLLRPLLGPRAVITGTNNQLVIRATPEQIAEIKRLLRSIDARPRQLVIFVRQAREEALEESSAAVGARAHVGRDAQVVVGDLPKDARVLARVTSSRSAKGDNLAQQVRVIEGRQAYIQTGEAAPVPITTETFSADGRRITRSTEYRTAVRGFYVTPRVSGDRVSLDIATANDRWVGGQFSESQQVVTTVSGTLGEWIEIGGVAEQARDEQTAILGSSKQARQREQRVLLKVEEAR